MLYNFFLAGKNASSDDFMNVNNFIHFLFIIEITTMRLNSKLVREYLLLLLLFSIIVSDGHNNLMDMHLQFCFPQG